MSRNTSRFLRENFAKTLIRRLEFHCTTEHQDVFKFKRQALLRESLTNIRLYSKKKVIKDSVRQRHGRPTKLKRIIRQDTCIINHKDVSKPPCVNSSICHQSNDQKECEANRNCDKSSEL